MEGLFQSSELHICDNYNKNDDNYTKFFALYQQEKIIETARILVQQFLHGLASKEEAYYSASNVYSTEFQSVLETVDALVEWLERSGNDVAENLKKKEAILRGVLRLTGKLSQYAHEVILLQLKNSTLSEGKHGKFQGLLM